MSNIKYRVKFDIEGLDKESLRDFKIDLINTNFVLEFDSDSEPRIPRKDEVIKINNNKFTVSDIQQEFIKEGNQFFNVFIVSLKDNKQVEENNYEEILNKLRIYGNINNKIY